MQVTKVLSTLLAFSALASATGPSYIAVPANGTHIAPGSKFNFTYQALGDYCESSFHATVWIFTSKPENFDPAQTWITGTFIGRYNTETGPLPTQLTMPDYSKSPGGFGTPEEASNKPVYLAVLEETATCDAALGDRIALNYITLIYNATKSGQEVRTRRPLPHFDSRLQYS